MSSDVNSQEILNKIFFTQYKPLYLIGEGSFGKCFKGINLQNNEDVCFKIEKKSQKSFLKIESIALERLKGGKGIPDFYLFGYSDSFNILIMELLEKTIENIFEKNNKKFSIKTVAILSIQLLNRIEYIHKKGYIHRDIKPENFMTGRNEYRNVLYLIDFGLSKKYIDSKTGNHVKFTNNHRLNGTARYASIHALEGFELSRRDDLESLCYVLVYFLKGSLPWSKIKNKNKIEKYKMILNNKKKISDEMLIGDSNNIEFIKFLKYCRNLKFEEKPDYDYLRGLMITSINKHNKIYINNKLNKDIFEIPLSDFHQKKTERNIRTYSAKKVKINLINKQILNKRNEYDNCYDIDKKINETKSGTLAYIEKKVRNYSNYKKNDTIKFQKLFDNKKKYNTRNNNLDIKEINIRVINKTKTHFNKDITSTTSSSNHDNKKYSLTKLDLIKKAFGINTKKSQTVKEEEIIEEEDSNDDKCIII